MGRLVFCFSFWLLLLSAGSEAALAANSAPVELLNIQAPKDGPRERIYFHSPSGNVEALLSLRKQLLRQGARRVNLFAPFVVVCEMPHEINCEEYLANTDINLMREEDIKGEAAGDYVFGPKWVKQCYKTAAKMPANETEDARVLEALARFKMPDLKLPNRPGEPIAVSSPAEADDRLHFQNSEFMIGDILIQVVYPESEGTEENWSEGRLSQAGSAVALAALYFQETYPRVPMDFVIRSVPWAHTITEPINFRREEQAVWVTDVMNHMGYDGDSSEYLQIVNQFNNDWRKQWGTDWVFTIFIVDSTNDPDHLFGVQPAKPLQLVVAELGGPHMAVPFPASFPGTAPLKQLLIYGMGHIFWAVFEHWTLPQYDCYTFSGYLNYQNWNKTVSIGPMDAREGCSVSIYPAFCIMNIEDVYFYYIQNPCVYTTGMLGLADKNDNRVPDAVDAAPTVVFKNSVVETTLTDSFLLEFQAVATAVPNRNSQQQPSKRRNYALPVKDVNYLVNGVGPIQVLPKDGNYDGLVEDCEIELQTLIPGYSTVEVITRNTLGTTSKPFVKRIFFIGLCYIHFHFSYMNDGIGIAWNMLGETFDADLNLHRIEMEPFPRDTVVASHVQPALPASGYFTPYYVLDQNVVARKKYKYYVEGTFTTCYCGKDTTINYTSDMFDAVASLHIDKQNIISAPSPNPFRDQTWISIMVPTSTRQADFQSSVPNPHGKGTRSPAVQDDVPTSVDISIYNALGQRVKHLHSGWSYSTILTIPWDGTNDNNERVPSGIYFLKATAGPYTQVRKVSIVR
jgi:hypothetical protein